MIYGMNNAYEFTVRQETFLGAAHDYNLSWTGPFCHGTGNYGALEYVSERIIRVIEDDIERGYNKKPIPAKAVIITGHDVKEKPAGSHVIDDGQLSLKNVQRLRILLNRKRKTGFPEFVYPTFLDDDEIEF